MSGRASSARTAGVLVLTILSLTGLLHTYGGIKVLDSSVTKGIVYPDEPIVRLIDDVDQRLWDDLIVAYPHSDVNGTDSGELWIFWGEGNPLMDLSEDKADIRIVGEPGWELGSSFDAWDFDGNWNDLAIGCPGAGKVLLFDSLMMAIQSHGKVFNASEASMTLTAPGTTGLGIAMSAADFTGEGKPDLMVLSDLNATVDPAVTIFIGGVTPDMGLTFPLPRTTVDPETQVTHLDMMGAGKENMVISSPSRSSIKVLTVNVTETPIPLAGADADGVVRFTGAISSTGDTFGWGQADDGWDRSPAHAYDALAGPSSVRYNQATGNVKGDRSVGSVNELQIEIGGIPGSGDDMSGAYGISFAVTPQMLAGANSVMLNFNYRYEDWGFENDERIWIKARFWDHDGTVTWLGRPMDGAPEPDATNEVFTMRGVQNMAGVGQDRFGSGRYSEEVLDLFDGPGSYYMDMGGKISKWSAGGECAAMTFDNLSMVIRQVGVSYKNIAGSGGLGASLHVQDTDLDGRLDLLASAPQEGKVRIFEGFDTYWAKVPTIDAASCNSTIVGTPGQMFGHSMAYMPSTRYCITPSILVTDPMVASMGREGVLYHFICPIPKGPTGLDKTRDTYYAPEGIATFGFNAYYLGDRDTNGYGEWRVLSWSDGGNLTISSVDSSPYPPDIRLLYPRVMMTINETVEIKVKVFDHDGDCDPWRLKVYRSFDNKSWIYLGDVERLDGDIAVRSWNTTKFENGRHFLKYALKDDFGLETVRYSNWIEVYNPRPPTVQLAFPVDGARMANTVYVAAKVTVGTGDNISSPVVFSYSRDGADWSVLSNQTFVMEDPEDPFDDILSMDFAVELNTTTMEDGPIWFRVDARTGIGMSSFARNLDPAYIDNNYPPRAEFTFPANGSEVSGPVDVRWDLIDRDMDINWPISLELRPDGGEWAEIASLGQNDTHFAWNTSTVENGLYDLSLRMHDRSMNDVRSVLTGVTVHNLYTPSVSFDGIGEGEILREGEKIVVVILDRDFNIDADGISFEYRAMPDGPWMTLGDTNLHGAYADVTWNTLKVKNGDYQLRATVTDRDGLIGMTAPLNVVVHNFYSPIVTPYRMPFYGSDVSGAVEISFNISDDEPVEVRNIAVEVFAKGSWERLSDPMVYPGGRSFVPWENTSYVVTWDTLEEGASGLRRFPDYQGYNLRINVTDADGRTGGWQTPKSYTVRNEVGDDTNFLTGPGGKWLIAIVFFVLLFVILGLVLVVFLFKAESGRRPEEVEAPSPLVIPHPPMPRQPTPQEQSAADIYAPVTGTGEPVRTGPSKEELEAAFSAISMAQEPTLVPEQAPLREPKPRPKPQARPKVKPRMDLDSVMPKKALPKKLREESWDDEEVAEFDDWEE